MLRLLAIAFVWLGCGVTWMILGSTLVARTNSVTNALDSEVHALWGPPGRQQPCALACGDAAARAYVCP